MLNGSVLTLSGNDIFALLGSSDIAELAGKLVIKDNSDGSKD